MLGGLYLLYLALNYLGRLGASGGDTDEAHGHHSGVGGFWSVVLVELADLAFSLDNVVAAVSLSDDIGAARRGARHFADAFRATIFSRMISWEPNQTAAYLLILAISIELLLDDLFGIHFQPLLLGPLELGPEVQQSASRC